MYNTKETFTQKDIAMINVEKTKDKGKNLSKLKIIFLIAKSEICV